MAALVVIAATFATGTTSRTGRALTTGSTLTFLLIWEAMTGFAAGGLKVATAAPHSPQNLLLGLRELPHAQVGPPDSVALMGAVTGSALLFLLRLVAAVSSCWACQVRNNCTMNRILVGGERRFMILKNVQVKRTSSGLLGTETGSFFTCKETFTVEATAETSNEVR